MKKYILSIVAIILTISIAACSSTKEPDKHVKSNSESEEHMDMNHSSSSEVPKGLKVAANPKFQVGSKATIQADHMKGMKGAEATIVGAYDTTAYIISYTPTTGEPKVKNHKWVIQEEIKNADGKTFKPGDEVTIEADHMKGMKGAKAEIVSAEKTTVYMVDYKPTNGGKEVMNHKWVTESELS